MRGGAAPGVTLFKVTHYRPPHGSEPQGRQTTRSSMSTVRSSGIGKRQYSVFQGQGVLAFVTRKAGFGAAST